ncbi:MAG TPA: hypothetical protein VGB63_16220 [Pedobacter sp.]|jgi:hypothetical protein
MKIPFRLNEGIYFEDTGNILLWNDTLENIKEIDNPELGANGSVLKWFDKLCFAGQRVNVTISVNEYHNTNGILEFVNFEQGRNDPHGVYQKFSMLFKEHLGEPSETSDDGFGRPTALWTINDLQVIIGIGERFMEYEIFGIHKGKPFWTLKNNDRITQPLQKRRVTWFSKFF